MLFRPGNWALVPVKYEGEGPAQTASQSPGHLAGYFAPVAKVPFRRSGVSAERRQPKEIDGCGFQPKVAMPLLQRSHFANWHRAVNSPPHRVGRKPEPQPNCLRVFMGFPIGFLARDRRGHLYIIFLKFVRLQWVCKSFCQAFCQAGGKRPANTAKFQ